jgi:hypothetical protein
MLHSCNCDINPAVETSEIIIVPGHGKPVSNKAERRARMFPRWKQRSNASVLARMPVPVRVLRHMMAKPIQ